jgi:hypothetical protein
VERTDFVLDDIWPFDCTLLQEILEKGVEIFGSESQSDNDKNNLQPYERRVIIVTAENNAFEIKDIPQFSMTKVREFFHFPPNHPIAGTSYAMCEVLPNNYVQLSNFHDYVKDSKHAAFINICRNLGAKEIRVESVVINNKALDMNSDISGELAEAGFNLSVKQDSEGGAKIAMSFGEGNAGVKEIPAEVQPWITTEPTWGEMIKGRRESDMKAYSAEFNHTDEMGVDANLSAKLAAVNINIGGSFHEMTKVKLKYKVLFW